MGYTHYYSQNHSLTESEWHEVCEGVRKITEAARSKGIELQWEDDDPRPVEINDDFIRFNGKGESGHETFYLPRMKGNDYLFTKTARKPYDEVVVAVLAFIGATVPDGYKIRTDAALLEEWDAALALCEKATGVRGRLAEDLLETFKGVVTPAYQPHEYEAEF